MSYEGYREYLCERGHRTETDCYDGRLTVCPICGAAMAYGNSVDETNGQDPNLPYTMPAPVRQIGEETYTATRPLFAPLSGWSRIKP